MPVTTKYLLDKYERMILDQALAPIDRLYATDAPAPVILVDVARAYQADNLETLRLLGELYDWTLTLPPMVNPGPYDADLMHRVLEHLGRR